MARARPGGAADGFPVAGRPRRAPGDTEMTTVTVPPDRPPRPRRVRRVSRDFPAPRRPARWGGTFGTPCGPPRWSPAVQRPVAQSLADGRSVRFGSLLLGGLLRSARRRLLRSGAIPSVSVLPVSAWVLVRRVGAYPDVGLGRSVVGVRPGAASRWRVGECAVVAGIRVAGGRHGALGVASGWTWPVARFGRWCWVPVLPRRFCPVGSVGVCPGPVRSGRCRARI